MLFCCLYFLTAATRGYDGPYSSHLGVLPKEQNDCLGNTRSVTGHMIKDRVLERLVKQKRKRAKVDLIPILSSECEVVTTGFFQFLGMAEPEDYDVIVIGGGAVGLSTAYNLALRDPKPKVLVLEKHSFFNDSGSSNDICRFFRTVCSS